MSLRAGLVINHITKLAAHCHSTGESSPPVCVAADNNVTNNQINNKTKRKEKVVASLLLVPQLALSWLYTKGRKIVSI